VSYGLAIQHEIQWGARAMPAVMATNSADQSLARFCVADRFARFGLVKLAESQTPQTAPPAGFLARLGTAAPEVR